MTIAGVVPSTQSSIQLEEGVAIWLMPFSLVRKHKAPPQRLPLRMQTQDDSILFGGSYSAHKTSKSLLNDRIVTGSVRPLRRLLLLFNKLY